MKDTYLIQRIEIVQESLKYVQNNVRKIELQDLLINLVIELNTPVSVLRKEEKNG